MLTFLLPKGWCEEIDHILKDFWWGFPTQKSRNYTPWAWDAICLPKELEGLGVRKMFEVNKALVVKLGWRLITAPECLWVRIARVKYKVVDPLVPTFNRGNRS